MQDVGTIAQLADTTLGPVHICCEDTEAEFRRFDEMPAAERPPEIALVGVRFNTGLEQRERLVVRDSAHWERVWSRLAARVGPREPTPAVDFGREMIIVVAMGERRSGGFDVDIDSIRSNGRELLVYVTEETPGEFCGTTAALTTPAGLARLRRVGLPVRFVERKEIRECK
jgi:hypothetical protein